MHNENAVPETTPPAGEQARDDRAPGKVHTLTTDARAWHAEPVAEVLTGLDASERGLSPPAVAERLERHGRNALPQARPTSPLIRFLKQFDNLLIYVLLAAAVVTALLGHPIDTAVILGVVVVNAVIGYIQEGKAEAALEAIRNMISPRASVLRDGTRVTVDAAEIVPGDILLLEAGDRVTADVRLIKARNLSIDEAILTGESVPVRKETAPVDAAAPLGDRTSLAFSGTLVTSGQGAGVVVATGRATELGRISGLIGAVERIETPLIRQMNQFARQLTFIILGLAAITFAFATLVRGYGISDAFLAVVGMAVAAIPEGLPAVMTVTLAIGVQRMAGRNAIIRRLPAVETLGSVSTICSDKTGTLTRNEMTVTAVVLNDRTFEVSGVGYAPDGAFSAGGATVEPADEPRLVHAARIALACNDASVRSVDGIHVVDGDPMEGALVVVAQKAGLDRARLAADLPRRDEIPFDAAHRYMATLHVPAHGAPVVFVKGAPEQLIEMCDQEASREGQRSIDRAFWREAIERLARDGRRVLAVASRTLADGTTSIGFDDVQSGLTLVGLVGLIDPPRPEAIAAIAECRTAGVAVKMITGDHVATASAIARELGLEAPERVLSGADLDGLTTEQFSEAVRQTSVFARTSPEHKLRLVEAMQAEGAVIAMTGDGVNDAPALKRADVGVAMGRGGTEAAKEASEMVLADDNFASIVAAVREGRTVYDNLSKVIGWTLPTNGGETLIVLAAILLGVTLPLTPVQILWINMVTAVGLGLVLAFEPAEPGVMTRPPRDTGAALLSPILIWRVAFVSVLFAIGAFSVFAWAKSQGAPIEEARTLVVNTIVVMEIFYLFSVRYVHGSSLTLAGMLGTPAVLIGVGGIVVLQLAFTYAPFMQILFATQPLSLLEGGVAILAGVALFAILELEKLIRRRYLETA
ncbi:MAG: cation-transporting P-type ATPase [Hyphomicrobiaceae bacterium]